MGWEWLQGMVYPSRLADAVLVNAILDMIARKTPELYAAQTQALIHRPDATPLLSESAARPCCYVGGKTCGRRRVGTRKFAT